MTDQKNPPDQRARFYADRHVRHIYKIEFEREGLQNKNLNYYK